MDHLVIPVNTRSHAHTFTQLLSPTRRGARLARLLAVTQLHTWEAPQDLTERAELVVGELAANAVLHGLVPGRCFRLSLALEPTAGRLRVEVVNARGESPPRLPAAGAGPEALPDGGRGLLLVAPLSGRWECVPYPPGGKTVRAELSPS
ncbi:ATP-binding protein [Streptomyces sp. SH5]|uniref:ATP-binding protein n=1 Tax=Streptomyces sp. SH5 TaxID=3041765 RepID=UPI002477D864|nr:ATP-binding protein [Streptomyces sp. SH5]WGP13333.1 ATP-binding protein [Streptomyces sp. SH5]